LNNHKRPLVEFLIRDIPRKTRLEFRQLCERRNKTMNERLIELMEQELLEEEEERI